MGKTGPQPRKTISCTWNSNMAYVVGLFASDGCLSKDGRHLDFTSTDLELIYHVQNVLCLQHIKIGIKNSGRGNKAFRLQFGNVLFYAWLVEIGLHPNKSHTLGELKIPDKYFFDFLRGVYDGDGCMYGYFDPRWKSSYMFYFSIASASLVFICYLQQIVERLSGARGVINRSGGGTWQLRYAKRETRLVTDLLYAKKNSLYLERKFEKMNKIYTIDQHNM